MAKKTKQDIEKINNEIFKNLDNDAVNIAKELNTLNSNIKNKSNIDTKLLEKEKSLKLKKNNE